MPMMIALKAATPQLPRTTAVADHVVAVDETDSTNALAVQMIGDGSLTLPDHQDGELAVAVVAADRQTAGRGRNGHKWVSQPGRCSTMSYAVRIQLFFERGNEGVPADEGAVADGNTPEQAGGPWVDGLGIMRGSCASPR